jgi:hypothetical protein
MVFLDYQVVSINSSANDSVIYTMPYKALVTIDMKRWQQGQIVETRVYYDNDFGDPVFLFWVKSNASGGDLYPVGAAIVPSGKQIKLNVPNTSATAIFDLHIFRLPE